MPSTKTIIGLPLLLVGGGVIVVGIYLALTAFTGMYQNAVTNPLGQPDGAEQKVSADMMKGLTIGACGVLPFLIGSFMVKSAARDRMRARRM